MEDTSCSAQQGHQREPLLASTGNTSITLATRDPNHHGSARHRGQRYRYVRDQVLQIPHIIEVSLFGASSLQAVVDLLCAIDMVTIDSKLLCDALMHVFGRAHEMSQRYRTTALDDGDVELMLKLDAYGFWCSGDIEHCLEDYVWTGGHLDTIKQEVAIARRSRLGSDCRVEDALKFMGRCFADTRLFRPEGFHFRLALGWEYDVQGGHGDFEHEEKVAELARESLPYHDPEIKSPDPDLNHQEIVYLLLCDKWLDLVWNDDSDWNTVRQTHACAAYHAWREWTEIVCNQAGQPWDHYFETDENLDRFPEAFIGSDKWIARHGVSLFLRLPAYFPHDEVRAMRVWLLLAAEHLWYCFLTIPSWGFVELARNFMLTHKVLVRIPNTDRISTQIPA
ncbi:hypothetical protein LTR17_009958 [Elasticomyces elasticus]|nr:hypothetical protein LTR17_009958 [Elasticomyces elasticus]